MRTTRHALVVVLAALALVGAGCGGDDDEGASETTTETTETTTTSGGEATAGAKLIGTVGTSDDPDAFVISLTTEDGSEVATLMPGDYTLEIDDQSTIHNFHLTGPGGVDVSSDVGETESEEYAITLEAGTYEFVCDPHASQMNGTLEVSG